jgi:hypothetical protein
LYSLLAATFFGTSKWRNPMQPESPLDANRRYNKLMEAMHDFKSAVLEYYQHEVVAAQAALQRAGIVHPSIVTGINDLATLRDTATDALIDAMEEELTTWNCPGDGQSLLDFAKEWSNRDK